MSIVPWPSNPSYSEWYATGCEQVEQIDQIEQIDSLMSDVEIQNARHSPILTHSERFKNLQQEYFNIFNCKHIEVVKNHLFPLVTPDVGQDKFLIVHAHLCPHIGTSGLGSCIAICATAIDRTGRKVLALAHASDPASALIKLNAELINKKCSQFKFYLLGGILDNYSQSIQSQEDVIKLSKKYPIKGALFNLPPLISESAYHNPKTKFVSLSIILSAEKIICSLHPHFFKSPQGKEWGEFIE